MPSSTRFTIEDVREGLRVWERKASTSNWPLDLHNSMYTDFDMSKESKPFTPEWFDRFLAPRIVSWRAYRGSSMAVIRRLAIALLPELKRLYTDSIIPLLTVPFADLTWEQVKEFCDVIAKAKTNNRGKTQESPVFRSKVAHWIAPRLFPVSDQEVIGVSGTYEDYWNYVHESWIEIPATEQAEMIEVLKEFISKHSNLAISAQYPFEVKIIELAIIGRRNKTVHISAPTPSNQKRLVVRKKKDGTRSIALGWPTCPVCTLILPSSGECGNDCE